MRGFYFAMAAVLLVASQAFAQSSTTQPSGNLPARIRDKRSHRQRLRPIWMPECRRSSRNFSNLRTA